MRNTWLKVMDDLFRPAQTRLAACARERELHLEARRLVAEARGLAIAQCTSRIEAVRAEVFAANNGIVSARMTELEREWRRLARPDLEGGLMDLWSKIAPPRWIDRKRWRESPPAARLDAAIALASNPDGVEAAEAAALALRQRLLAVGKPLPARVHWTPFTKDFEGTSELLREALATAMAALYIHGETASVADRAKRFAGDIEEAAEARFPGRSELTRGIAHAAFVDFVWRAAALSPEMSPTGALQALWSTGYAIEFIDERRIALAFPQVQSV